jgi:hypothetical protein
MRRKPRKLILPKNNPGISVVYEKRKSGNNARYIALEPPQTIERAGSNPGFFYPPGGCAVLEIGCRRPTISHTYTPAIFSCVFFGSN